MVIDNIVPPRPGDFRQRGFLTGRTALVTGGAKRIGRALAVALAHDGADVVVHCHHSRTEAEQTAALVEKEGGRGFLVEGDLADTLTARKLVDEAGEKAGRPVDLLVNNASVFRQGSVAETDALLWDEAHSINLQAPFLLSQAVAAQLPADHPGDIINLNDIRALNPGPDHLAYTISKVGLHGLTRSLAQALAPAIRVNELALGAVLPPDKPSQQYQHTKKSDLLTGQFPKVEQVVDAMLFLLGNTALTGQTIEVAGGQW